jgi:hypothetical protein
MKNILIKISSCFLFIAISSCKKGFLDQVPDDRLTTDKIFNSNETTMNFLANVYSFIPDEANQRFVTTGSGKGNSGPWTGASDEAEYTWSFVTSNNMNIGAWDPTNGFVNTFWTRFYQGIRAASDFINGVGQCTNCDNPKQWAAEARALRAMYYYYLVRMYGPVVILGDVPAPIDAPLDQILLPRNSMDECINFITSELDKAMPDLIQGRPSSESTDLGRITRSVAHAFKIQALMLGASPLFNGNTDYAQLKNRDGKQLIPQQFDVNKWKKAADAAKEFIDRFVPSVHTLFVKNDLGGNFSPYLSLRDVMTTDHNPEWIFSRPDASMGTLQYDRTPYHAGAPNASKGGGGLAVTQAQVDAYFAENGYPIDNPASGYVSTGFSNFQAPFDNQARQTYNPWTKREPRFYVNVTYNNSRWLNTSAGDVITQLNFSGNSGAKGSGSDYPPTGYVVRKNAPTGNWSDGGRALVLMRLALIYLDYAEALNEYSPGNPEILKYLNAIRQRAGIPQYGSGANALPVPADQVAMREAIRRERRVELSFENVRYFDTRRWKIAETTDNGPAKGLSIGEDGLNFYNVRTFENRVFVKKHYLFPIPQNEWNINRNLVQNTGW